MARASSELRSLSKYCSASTRPCQESLLITRPASPHTQILCGGHWATRIWRSGEFAHTLHVAENGDKGANLPCPRRQVVAGLVELLQTELRRCHSPMPRKKDVPVQTGTDTGGPSLPRAVGAAPAPLVPLYVSARGVSQPFSRPHPSLSTPRTPLPPES